MYRFLRKFLIFISDIEQIFSPEYKRPRRWGILRAYLRLRIKASLNRWFHFTHEHFLNYHVSFPDYEIFFVEFRQIFVRNAYYFVTTERAPTILDCGGNIGMSVLYFKYLYPNARITVFEPSTEVLPSIQKNIAQNNLSDVELVQKAVTDKDGVATMYPRGSAACGNTLNESLAESTPTKTTDAGYTVPTTALSPYTTQQVDFLKLDIEGSEGIVLTELAQSATLKNIGALVMEYHPHANPLENNLATIIETLQNVGWRIELFSEDDVTVHSISLRTIEKVR